MMIPSECPKCRASMMGEPIPEKDREVFGGVEWFSRVIGFTDPDKDGAWRWECPDCGHEWLDGDGGG